MEVLEGEDNRPSISVLFGEFWQVSQFPVRTSGFLLVQGASFWYQERLFYSGFWLLKQRVFWGCANMWGVHRGSWGHTNLVYGSLTTLAGLLEIPNKLRIRQKVKTEANVLFSLIRAGWSTYQKGNTEPQHHLGFVSAGEEGGWHGDNDAKLIEHCHFHRIPRSDVISHDTDVML